MFQKLARPGLDKLAGFPHGKPLEDLKAELGLEEIISLASNENSWGVSPKAVKALVDEAALVNRYPEGSCLRLREKLAGIHGVDADMLIVGNGGSEVLWLLVTTLMNPGDEAVMAEVTFPIYKRHVALAGAKPVPVPMREYVHDLDAMLEAVNERTKLVYVCNPNNPTGTLAPREALDAFVEKLPSHVLMVLDEVYEHYTDQDRFADGLEYVKAGRKVISIRSFSKLYGLAGLRVGYGVAHPELIGIINKAREVYPVNRMAMAASLAALTDEKFKHEVVAKTLEGRAWLTEKIRDLGLYVAPSETNFIFINTEKDAAQIHAGLLRQGVLVQAMAGAWGAPTCIRCTVGTPKQNRKLVDALALVMRETS